MIHPDVIEEARKIYFPSLAVLSETVTDAFKRWAKEENKNTEEDNEENRNVMLKMAQFARAAWLF